MLKWLRRILCGSTGLGPVGAVLIAQGKYAGVGAQAVIVASGARQILGWSIATGGAGQAHIRDGGDPSAPIVGVVRFAGAGSDTEWFADQGVQLVGGGKLYFEVVSGTFEGVVYYV